MRRRSPRLAAKAAKAQSHVTLEYMAAGANVVARIMNHMNLIGNKTNRNANLDFNGFNTKYIKADKSVSFIETYSLKSGLKKFGTKGEVAAYKEMKQLHDRGVFKPMYPKNLLTAESRKILESIIFLIEKRDGTIKALDMCEWKCTTSMDG